MPNNYFQFKQFRVNQQGAGMKVTTEGCLLGAWAATFPDNANAILDIGAGTGLLSLMLAQQYPKAKGVGVELEKHSAEIARQNFAQSPWSENLSLTEGAIQHFKAAVSFDLIVSNPPFFNNDHVSSNEAEKMARHDENLDFTDLLSAVDRLLSVEGVFYLLLPRYQADHFISLAKGILKPTHLLDVFHRHSAQQFRRLVRFERGKEPRKMNSDELVIKKADDQYTDEFVKLLKPYYLHL